MVAEFIKGQPQEYVAQIDFGLNFDDRNVKSVKIKKGHKLRYDGEVVSYLSDNGENIIGPCSHLKSAITNMKWLIPCPDTKKSETKESEQEESMEDLFENEVPVPKALKNYDSLRGGNFDSHMAQNPEFVVAGKHKVIKEEDLIVGSIPSLKKPEKEEKKSDKFEIALDQATADERLVVSSTTANKKEGKRKPEIIRADEMNSDAVLPLKIKKEKSSDPQKKSSFVVDKTTPRTVNEDMTLDEIQRITKVEVSEESQDAKVVSKIDRSKIKVQQVEGITLNKVKPRAQEDITFNKTKSPKEMTIKTTVGSGGTEIFDSTQNVDEVAKINKDGSIAPVKEETLPEKEETIPEKEGTVPEKEGTIPEKEGTVPEKEGTIPEKEGTVPEKEGTIPQKEGTVPEKEKKGTISDTTEKTTEESVVSAIDIDDLLSDVSIKPKSEESAKKRADQRKKSASNTQTAMESERKQKTKKGRKSSKTKKDSNYLLMLPDDWGKLHWVKKEKFIKEQTDIKLIEYILSVETVKAVLNACRERLKELGQEVSD